MSTDPNEEWSKYDTLTIPIINQTVSRRTFHLIHASAFIVFVIYAMYTIQQNTEIIKHLRYTQGRGRQNTMQAGYGGY